MNMKLLTVFMVFILLGMSSLPAKAEGFWEATGKYLEKYGIPCAAGVAAGYVIDHDKGVKIGSIGCVMIFTYGEFGRGSNRTITTDDIAIIQEMNNRDLNRLGTQIKEEADAKYDRLNQRLTDESMSGRQNVRNAVTDLGVFLEKDLSEKVDRRMENPKLIQDVDAKINLKVKEEVQDEFRSKEREIIEKTTEKVIKRVTAEPIVTDDIKVRPSADTNK
jgi:hypothetical protein